MNKFANNTTPAQAGVWPPHRGINKYVPDARLRGHGED